jgi:hypothetical protein
LVVGGAGLNGGSLGCSATACVAGCEAGSDVATIATGNVAGWVVGAVATRCAVTSDWVVGFLADLVEANGTVVGRGCDLCDAHPAIANVTRIIARFNVRIRIRIHLAKN